jgi:hypothetical protein
MGWAGHVAKMGEMRIEHKILVGKPEGKTAYGRLTLSWEGNIRMNFMEIGWEVVNLKHVAQDMDQWRTLVNTEMNFRFP